MSSEWITVPLNALCDPRRGITYGIVKVGDFVPGGVPVVRGGDIREGLIVCDDSKRVTDEVSNQFRRTILKGGEIVLNLISEPGHSAIVPVALAGHNVSRDVAVIPLADHVDVRFMDFFLRSSMAINWLSARLQGSVTQKINLGTLRELPIRLPPRSEQQAISKVLGSIDDRITLLRKTNATLEAIAQALFKSWFVDFDPVRAKQEGRAPEGMDDATAALFPDGFEESELGLVPRGWKAGVFSDVCSRIESGGTPKRTVPEYWNGSVSWLTSGEVRNPIVFDTKETISDLGVKGSSAKLWPQGTTVVAMYGATAGEVCLLAKPTTANQACCGLIPKSHSRVFMFMCARRERKALASKSSGSAQQNLNKGLIENHPLIAAPNEILEAYEGVAGVVLDRWIENEMQAQTLATLRDTLLPRLISGQLRLPEPEAIAISARV